ERTVPAPVDPAARVREGGHTVHQPLSEAIDEGVSGDRAGDCCRVPGDGVRWLLCQAHSHSHQQCPCGRLV
ncbi:Probable protein transport protein Sec61 subunit gamma, partial [Taphrina deformans PYCC 5710]